VLKPSRYVFEFFLLPQALHITQSLTSTLRLEVSSLFQLSVVGIDPSKQRLIVGGDFGISTPLISIVGTA
jgi:hypothetical protein